jgi:hypothetical protein
MEWTKLGHTETRDAVGSNRLLRECLTLPRQCSVCIHDRRQQIEQALLCGDSYRIVAQRFAVSRDAVVRHRRHLPAILAHARELKEVANPDSLLAQLHELVSEAQRLKAVAETAGDYRAALGAIRELCRIIELKAKLTGEMGSPSQTNILNVTLDAETAQRISATFLARHRLENNS